mmetsp:Transcript_1831/g.2564  ORF Transcript_1831/g.2564 Transcript_1831/m.2564 type:complete len:124 (+) Transcript_1831:314-685(+)
MEGEDGSGMKEIHKRNPLVRKVHFEKGITAKSILDLTSDGPVLLDVVISGSKESELEKIKGVEDKLITETMEEAVGKEFPVPSITPFEGTPSHLRKNDYGPICSKYLRSIIYVDKSAVVDEEK